MIHLRGEGGTCGHAEAAVLHVQKYVGVDAKTVIELSEDAPSGSPFRRFGSWARRGVVWVWRGRPCKTAGSRVWYGC